MKRPLLLYLVAAWCSLGLLIQFGATIEVLRKSLATTDISKVALSCLSLAAFAFVLWHMIGLINMRRLHRWIAFCFFVMWTAAQVLVCLSSVYRETVRLLPALFILLVFITPNLLGGWYLSRRRFREFAVRFVAERESVIHSRSMQRVSEQKIQEDARN